MSSGLEKNVSRSKKVKQYAERMMEAIRSKYPFAQVSWTPRTYEGEDAYVQVGVPDAYEERVQRFASGISSAFMDDKVYIIPLVSSVRYRKAS